jgi:hypothetical protein
MQIGQPQFLPLLALATLPILIHLLARRRRQVVPFAMTRFLQEANLQAQGRRWLRELLLLALRTGAVLFALLSLLAPLRRRPLAPSPCPDSHRPRRGQLPQPARPTRHANLVATRPPLVSRLHRHDACRHRPHRRRPKRSTPLQLHGRQATPPPSLSEFAPHLSRFGLDARIANRRCVANDSTRCCQTPRHHHRHAKRALPLPSVAAFAPSRSLSWMCGQTPMRATPVWKRNCGCP